MRIRLVPIRKFDVGVYLRDSVSLLCNLDHRFADFLLSVTYGYIQEGYHIH